MTVGERIYTNRKEQKKSRRELSQLSGVSESAIKQYETNKRQPQLDQLQRIADVLGIPMADFIGTKFSILAALGLSAEYQGNIESLTKIASNMPSDVLRAFVTMLDGATDDEIDKIISYGSYLRGISLSKPHNESFSLTDDKLAGDAE